MAVDMAVIECHLMANPTDCIAGHLASKMRHGVPVREQVIFCQKDQQSAQNAIGMM